MSFESKIEKLSVAFGRELVEAFRASLGDEIRRVAKSGGGPGRKPSRGGGKRHTPATCVKPGCKKPPTGPRFSYLCVDHRASASKADRKKWLGAWHDAHRA